MAERVTEVVAVVVVGVEEVTYELLVERLSASCVISFSFCSNK
jgi:hypothetical protein